MAEVVYPPVIAACKTAFRALDLRIEVVGAENVPRSGGAVLAGNHIGYLDFIFCGLGADPAGRLVRFMAKQEVFHHPVAGPLMRGMHHIPVDRSAGAASFRAAVQALRDGEVVGVFPEATISRSFELKEFKTGAARMARAAGVPLVPVVVWGTQRLLTKGRSPRMKRRGTPISISVGEPLVLDRGADPEEATAELKRRMEVLLHAAQERYPDRPRGPEDSWWLPARLGGTAPTPAEAAGLDARARPSGGGPGRDADGPPGTAPAE
ncbi:MAG TPA: lysophospholipid acyltransferase family protein [Miltoncostaeaceae bacterium]|nr:lysophospholipid acyltransferase family protein [Miltoncostaeaceae bacterium]